MNRKLSKLFALIVMSLILVSCGEDNHENAMMQQTKTQEIESISETEIQENGSKEVANQKSEQTYNINGITISVESFYIEPYDSEDYTKRIVMNFTIKNETDMEFGYVTTWDGKLRDGYELNGLNDIMSLDLKQVDSKSEKIDTVYFLLDDGIEPDEIIVSYNFKDYDEEYWEDFGKIMAGEMGQEEYMRKYGDFEVLEFVVPRGEDGI